MLDAGQIRAARALIGWSQADLAAACGLSIPTIKRLESKGPDASTVGTVRAVKESLEGAGVAFIEANGGGAGVRMAKPREETRKPL